MASFDVLIVDDDTATRDALAELLEKDGYTVRQAADGSIAVKMIEKLVPSVMLLDLEMPIMDGWEVLEWTHRDAALAAITVIVISAGASPPAGVTFVGKPCDAAELLRLVHRVAGREETRVPDSAP